MKNFDEGEGGEPMSQQHVETVKRLFSSFLLLCKTHAKVHHAL